VTFGGGGLVRDYGISIWPYKRDDPRWGLIVLAHICIVLLYIQKFIIYFFNYRSCLQENSDLKSTKTELNTLLVRQREEQDALKKVK
jgi:hypothetical protein